jgi:hypothetical protein
MRVRRAVGGATLAKPSEQQLCAYVAVTHRSRGSLKRYHPIGFSGWLLAPLMMGKSVSHFKRLRFQGFQGG